MVAFHSPSAITPSHVTRHRALARLHFSLLPPSSESAARKPGSSAATRSAQAQASTTTTGCIRQTLLGSGAKVLVWLETSPDHREPRDRGPLAPLRICTVGALSLEPAEETLFQPLSFSIAFRDVSTSRFDQLSVKNTRNGNRE